MVQSRDTRVLIILPVLNETQNVVPLLQGIQHELQKIPYQVCLIDDGSTDGTVEKIRTLIAEGLPLHLLQRRKTWRGSQRGSALKLGMEWGLQSTSATIFVEMDGDLSHRPEDLKAGIRLVADEGYDVAIASKYVPGSQVINRSPARNLVSRVCSIAVQFVLPRRVRDYSNGYRFYTRPAAELIAQHEIKYGSPIYLSEVLAIWLKHRLRVVEFPFVYVGRNEGLSKLRLIDLVKAAIAIFEISWRYHIAGFRTTEIAKSQTEYTPHRQFISTTKKSVTKKSL